MQNHIKNDIVEAFNNLIEKKDFDKITVQMILYFFKRRIHSTIQIKI